LFRTLLLSFRNLTAFISHFFLQSFRAFLQLSFSTFPLSFRPFLLSFRTFLFSLFHSSQA
jgi:hypothetical protein